MTCPLCQQREGNKKNTHYLTDGIIRPCLNLNGGTEREKGLYFNMSTQGYIEMNFQRATNVEELEKELGRAPNDEEIERAKQNAYAVDNVFCNHCEDIFSSIEDEFISTILPKFREADISSTPRVELEDVRLSRLFWLIQFWRSAVCASQLKITPATIEEVRQIILDHSSAAIEELTAIPISVTYLRTEGEPHKMTNNFVGFIDRKNPLIIFMCDFVLQVFDSEEKIAFEEMFGLNDSDFREYVNHKEKKFKVKVLSDTSRKEFLEKYKLDEAHHRLKHYAAAMSKLWVQLFGRTVPPATLQRYIDELTNNPEHDILHYSKANVLKITHEFIQRNAPC